MYNATVKDVDSYLAIPGSANPVFYFDKVGNGANLDVDDTDWAGPETITITNQLSGTYTYYVVNFSHPFLLSGIGQSKVKVAVYKGSQMIQEHNIPLGSGIIYKLFTINNGIITNENRYLTDPHFNGTWCVAEALKFQSIQCPF
jgi:hypothetical protein